MLSLLPSFSGSWCCLDDVWWYPSLERLIEEGHTLLSFSLLGKAQRAQSPRLKKSFVVAAHKIRKKKRKVSSDLTTGHRFAAMTLLTYHLMWSHDIAVPIGTEEEEGSLDQ